MDLKSSNIFVVIDEIGKDRKIFWGKVKGEEKDKLAFLKFALPQLVDCSIPQSIQPKTGNPSGGQLSLF